MTRLTKFSFFTIGFCLGTGALGGALLASYLIFLSLTTFIALGNVILISAAAYLIANSATSFVASLFFFYGAILHTPKAKEKAFLSDSATSDDDDDDDDDDGGLLFNHSEQNTNVFVFAS